jgi:hypothetical protein
VIVCERDLPRGGLRMAVRALTRTWALSPIYVLTPLLVS